jgi:riboflavin synthase
MFTGLIEAVGQVVDRTPTPGGFIVHKGSIAIDGVSLTVASLEVGRLEVQLVPYTLEHTNLSAKTVGDRVNLETDIVGKYVVRAAELGLTTARETG